MGRWDARDRTNVLRGRVADTDLKKYVYLGIKLKDLRRKRIWFVFVEQDAPFRVTRLQLPERTQNDFTLSSSYTYTATENLFLFGRSSLHMYCVWLYKGLIVFKRWIEVCNILFSYPLVLIAENSMQTLNNVALCLHTFAKSTICTSSTRHTRISVSPTII